MDTPSHSTSRAILIFMLLIIHTVETSITKLPRSNVVETSSGLILRYLNDYSPADRIVSFTVSFPMTWHYCYLIPASAYSKIPGCNVDHNDINNNSITRNKRFLPGLVAIGLGSAALAISAHNSIQVLQLQHEVTRVHDSLLSLNDATEVITSQLLHVQQGQMKIAQSLNYTQLALNQTIHLVNQHSGEILQQGRDIARLAALSREMEYKLNTFMHALDVHFLQSSLSDILSHKLNLRFIHHKDMHNVLNSIRVATNASFNLETTQLSLVELITRLLIQQHINFLPSQQTRADSDSTIGTLFISSFFAATTNKKNSFSLYELLTIPFPYETSRIRLADMPYMIGIDFTQERLITWTEKEAKECDFQAMSTCRQTPAILTQWQDTCIFQILTHTNLSSCHTEQYREPFFIQRIGSQWAISSNTSLNCYSASTSSNSPSFEFHDELRVIPAVSVVTIPPGTLLRCGRFSISTLSTETKSSLSLLDNSLLDTSNMDTIDLVPKLTNSTRWKKLPYISDQLHSVMEHLAKTSTVPPLSHTKRLHQHPFLTLFLYGMVSALTLFTCVFYWKSTRKSTIPSVSFQLPTISTIVAPSKCTNG